MKLTKLELLNFKGLKAFTINFNGDVIIRGDNATGKTTVFDSVCWLLFGKDSLDRADFEIKTLDRGEPVHKVNHEVTGTFTLDEGGTVELKRVYREKYSSPRGGEVTMTGHTTDYFVDGVPKKEKEYKEIVNSLVDENIFKLITNPLYFNETYSWQNRRKLLLEMCGDISDKDVIAEYSELKALTDILSGHSVDDHRKVVAAKKTAINKELDMIPVRIDEALRGKSTIDTPRDVLIQEISLATTTLETLEADKALLVNGHAVVDTRAELRDVQRRLMARESELQMEYKKQSALKSNEYDMVVSELNNLSSKVESTKHRLDTSNRDIQRIESVIDELMHQRQQVNEDAFVMDIDEACPTCGQKLPAEQIQAAREKAETKFNIRKSKQLEELNQSIELKQQDIENIKKRDAGLEPVETLEALIKAKELVKQTITDEIGQLTAPVLDDDSIYADLKAEEFMLQMKLDESNTDHSEEIADIDKRIATTKEHRFNLETELNKYEEAKRIDTRVAELESQQAELAAEKSKLDEASYLMDEFVKAKVNMLEDVINSRFKLARFKMFNVMLNGNVEECCETTYKGVPYRSMNNAARINVGLDIINALTSYFKVNAPVFIDNAEAVTEFVPVNSQTIKLIVDESEPQLVVKEV
ncbi:AAA family ATPase [Veillonella sp.]|uniref:AAA family ATPase n=1 Tax=Veillonella sp. TaxID=1926307 RepID=UPI00290FDA2B|nr:AAA family ATPase [Veillonella sp.]MDU4008554.1 AAA family ATPase [Veillonella sp.]